MNPENLHQHIAETLTIRLKKILVIFIKTIDVSRLCLNISFILILINFACIMIPAVIVFVEMRLGSLQPDSYLFGHNKRV